MKNLLYSLCLLIGFSSWATPIDSRIVSLHFNNIETNNTKKPDCQLDAFFKVYEENRIATAEIFEAYDTANEEADEAFDFDTTTYLPIGFNATIQFEDEAYAIEEADAPFDFNTTEYLPVGFNATLALDTEAYEAVNIEDDEAFDFNTADYLPVGFNVDTSIIDEIEEIILEEEEDESFDFDTAKYLPEGFDAHTTRSAESTLYYLNCIAFTSI